MKDTKYNLAPRGFRRTSFRLAEIIQIGRIPIYLFDDQKWIPYEGTNISFLSFGLSGRLNSLENIFHDVAKISEEFFFNRLKKVKEVREYYTLKGVLNQIDLFFRDPFGSKGGFLRCERMPNKDH
jgi:hypothetical protein